MPIFSNRLKEQRNSLGLSQDALANLCGISSRAQRNYEAGERSPDAEYLTALAAAGADVLYILTGQRSKAVREVELLPQDERILLDNYRNSPPEARAALKATSAAFAGARSARKAA